MSGRLLSEEWEVRAQAAEMSFRTPITPCTSLGLKRLQHLWCQVVQMVWHMMKGLMGSLVT